MPLVGCKLQKEHTVNKKESELKFRFFIDNVVIVLFRGNRYSERVQLGSIPELSMEEADNLQNLENFSVSELKTEDVVSEETVVYFNTEAGLGLNIQEGGLGEVTIQAIGLEMDVGEGGQVLSLVQIDEGMSVIGQD